MGCSSSRPVGNNSASADSTVLVASPATVPETAIIPTPSFPPAPLDRPSAACHAHNRPLRLSQQAALTEHYNRPLVRPGPWKSTSRTWTHAQLVRERSDFFETRITGRREVWEALRQVTECVREGDLATAQGILDAAGITLPTGKLENGAYDEAGNLYRLSRAVIHDPTNVVEEVEEEEDDEEEKEEAEGEGDAQTVVGVASSCAKDDKVVEVVGAVDGGDEASKLDEWSKGKGKAAVAKDAVAVRCRLSDRGGPDVVVHLGRKDPVRLLVYRVKEDGSLPNSATVRIAYLGHILDEKRSLSDQGWKESHVVNALVSGAYT